MRGRPLAVLVILWITACVSLLLALSSASAQPMPCGNAREIIAKLAQDYGERPVWGGVVPEEDGQVREVILLQSDEGSWTLLHIRGPLACAMAAGQNGTGVTLGEEV